jgi:hypothetical protein
MPWCLVCPGRAAGFCLNVGVAMPEIQIERKGKGTDQPLADLR